MKITLFVGLLLFSFVGNIAATETHSHGPACSCATNAPHPPRASYGSGIPSIFVAASALALASRSFKSA